MGNAELFKPPFFPSNRDANRHIGSNEAGPPERETVLARCRPRPFPAAWSFGVFLIDCRDWRAGRKRGTRYTGIAACDAATVALALTSLISTAFTVVHVLEDFRVIPKVLSHAGHALSPFDNAPMEEIAGAAVLGAWTALLAGRRWRTESSWIDRLGRLLCIFWIGLFLPYVYAYSG